MASNFAELGGGICLEAGSRIYSTSLHIVILRFANNNFANKGGAIYIADDTNVGECGEIMLVYQILSVFISQLICFMKIDHCRI